MSHRRTTFEHVVVIPRVYRTTGHRRAEVVVAGGVPRYLLTGAGRRQQLTPVGGSFRAVTLANQRLVSRQHSRYTRDSMMSHLDHSSHAYEEGSDLPSGEDTDSASEGISDDILRMLPTFTIQSTTLPVSAQTCQICLEANDLGCTGRILPCLHLYHADCIDKWLMTNSDCPVCRFNVKMYLEDAEKEGAATDCGEDSESGISFYEVGCDLLQGITKFVKRHLGAKGLFDAQTTL